MDRVTRPATRVAWIVGASLVLGALTSLAQTYLPDVLAPLANSAGGWTLLTVALVWLSRFPARPAALAGAASFVLLVLGYTLASRLRGFPYDPVLFLVVAVVAGPIVGVATAWLREVGLRAAAGTAVLAGIGVGETAYGLTVVASSTPAGYWVAEGIVALAFLAAMLATRLRGGRAALVAAGGTVVLAALFLAVYTGLGFV